MSPLIVNDQENVFKDQKYIFSYPGHASPKIKSSFLETIFAADSGPETNLDIDENINQVIKPRISNKKSMPKHESKEERQEFIISSITREWAIFQSILTDDNPESSIINHFKEKFPNWKKDFNIKNDQAIASELKQYILKFSLDLSQKIENQGNIDGVSPTSMALLSMVEILSKIDKLFETHKDPHTNKMFLCLKSTEHKEKFQAFLDIFKTMKYKDDLNFLDFSHRTFQGQLEDGRIGVLSGITETAHFHNVYDTLYQPHQENPPPLRERILEILEEARDLRREMEQRSGEIENAQRILQEQQRERENIEQEIMNINVLHRAHLIRQQQPERHFISKTEAFSIGFGLGCTIVGGISFGPLGALVGAAIGGALFAGVVLFQRYQRSH